MNVLIILLFILPGLITEFVYEMSGYGLTDKWFYKFLRGLAFNIPLTIIVWIVIWIWKVALHMDIVMITSLQQFWYKCINEPFLLKYCLVLLAEIIGFKLLLLAKVFS